jgi:hypothetical protein
LLSIFAAMATTRALIGFNGLLTYTASRRGPEMGIRIALGATRSDILRLFLGARPSDCCLGADPRIWRCVCTYSVPLFDPLRGAHMGSRHLSRSADTVPHCGARSQSRPRPTCGQLRSYDHSSS